MLDIEVEVALHRKLRDFSQKHLTILAVYKGKRKDKTPRPVYYFIMGRSYNHEREIEAGITQLDLELHTAKGILFHTKGIDLMTLPCDLKDAEQHPLTEKRVYKSQK